jgi:hypothetical protein
MGVARPCAVRRCGSCSLKAWGKVVGDIIVCDRRGKKAWMTCACGGCGGCRRGRENEKYLPSASCALLCRLPQHTARAHVLRGLDSTVPLTYLRPTFVHCTQVYILTARVSFLPRIISHKFP